jgi:hypothetical protein
LSAAWLAAKTDIRQQNMLRGLEGAIYAYSTRQSGQSPVRCGMRAVDHAAVNLDLKDDPNDVVRAFCKCGRFSEFQGLGERFSNFLPEQFAFRPLAHTAT